MAKNAARPAFGGWIEHGTDMQAWPTVVGPHFKFYTTPEQKEYVLSTLLSKPTTTPPVPTAPGDWAKAKQAFDDWFEIASNGDPWWSQSKSGRDHHRRAHLPAGLHAQLGQLRRLGTQQGPHRLPVPRPGEWFAELYAGYRSGKLGKKHPALEWLTKL
jgi:hypothetical protein